MLVFAKQWVINIVTLVLFIVMLEMLLPTGKMKKYVNLVTATILTIAIISPLVGLLGKNADFTALQISNSNILDKQQVESDRKLLEKEQMKQIVEVYRKKIIEQLELTAKEVEGVEQARADVIFNEDYNSNSFGKIKRAYLEITTAKTKGYSSKEGGSKEGGTLKTVTGVEQVRVGEVKKSEVINEDCDPVLRKKLEERISQVFGIKNENIIISQIKR